MRMTVAELESKKTREVASRYRSQGYEVTIGPTQEQLPPFLAGFSPDLLVRKGGNSMVVDVKYGPTMEREGYASALDDALRDRPDWRYMVVPVKLGDQLAVPKEAVVLTREDVLGRVVGAERLLEAGFTEAAFVQAWSAADGALRVLLEEEAELVGWPTSKYVISLAIHEGLISYDRYFFLRDALDKCTALTHGYALPEMDAGSVREVIDVAMGLAVEGELDWYPSSDEVPQA